MLDVSWLGQEIRWLLGKFSQGGPSLQFGLCTSLSIRIIHGFSIFLQVFICLSRHLKGRLVPRVSHKCLEIGEKTKSLENRQCLEKGETTKSLEKSLFQGILSFFCSKTLLSTESG